MNTEEREALEEDYAALDLWERQLKNRVAAHPDISDPEHPGVWDDPEEKE